MEKVKKLNDFYKNGKIPTLSEHEVHPDLEPGSRERYLYFTLPPCINFQRQSPSMWRSALKTYDDPETNYLFFPEKVVLVEREKIQKDLAKHKLSLQRNKHTDIWMAISRTLHDFFQSDPRNLLSLGDYDVQKILNIIQNEKKRYFPYLSGPKMANYWLYIVTKFTNAKLKNMSFISIIPDTHVLQSTVKLGLAPNIVTPMAAEKLWNELLRDSDLSPVELHPVLWNWSRNNFQPEV